VPRTSKKTSTSETGSKTATKRKSTKSKKNPESIPTSKVSALDAAALVLAKSGESLTCQQLIDAMTQQGLWTSTKGKTPANTLNAAIHKEIATKGDQSRFVKAERGKFSARPKA
jgi:hypothetical protein